ncbi:hypothetical protein M422DRAFT_42007 [Sphaerobolus stellatus SS14]|nr:hypothetical protein M422DRAFT_42007 [Sphaerobolus stellatus SS14]
MDRYTPATSFRTGRPLTRTRPRTRLMSPSPRPHHSHRSFTESSTLFIANPDPSDVDSDVDLIFTMSPIRTCFYPPPSPNAKPVNVMTLRNKTPRAQTRSPPLAPLLYSFPQPSRLHTTFLGAKKDSTGGLSSLRPLSAVSQNTRYPVDRRVRRAVSDDGVVIENGGEAGVPMLSSSLLGRSPSLSSSKQGTKAETSPSTRSRPHSPASLSSTYSSAPRAYPSSPIPIPRHTPRESDPGVYDLDIDVDVDVENPSSFNEPLSPLSPLPRGSRSPSPLPSSGLNPPSESRYAYVYGSYTAPPTQIEFESPLPSSSESSLSMNLSPTSITELDAHPIPITLLDSPSPIHDHDAYYEETSIRDSVPIDAEVEVEVDPPHSNYNTFSTNGSPFRFSRFLSSRSARVSPEMVVAIPGSESGSSSGSGSGSESSSFSSGSGKGYGGYGSRESAIMVLRKFAVGREDSRGKERKGNARV